MVFLFPQFTTLFCPFPRHRNLLLTGSFPPPPQKKCLEHFVLIFLSILRIISGLSQAMCKVDFSPRIRHFGFWPRFVIER